jgi:hypothetical protein
VTPADLLQCALRGALHVEAQAHLIDALRRHIDTGEALDDILGLRTRGNGPNPRTQVRLHYRDTVLRWLWADLAPLPDLTRAEVAADLLRRRLEARDGPADDLERNAEAVLLWNEGRPLSAARIRAICTASA